MWIVRLALRRPYTFTVVAILLVLMGIVTIARMSTDIFPNINIPVVSVIKDNRIHWQNIHVGRDFGTQLEVLDGLAENTKIVVNPTDDLREGLQVQVKSSEPPKGSGGQSPSGQ